MKKIIILFSVFFSLIMMDALGATTSDSLEMYENYAMLSYGKYKDFAPPLGITPSERESIDTMGGSVTITETDLVLPGKNGLDLTIARKYNSQTTETRYRYSESTENMYVYFPAYVYSYTDPDTNSTAYIYLAFPSEKLMRETHNDTVYLDIADLPSTTSSYYLEDLTYNGQNVPVYKSRISFTAADTGLTAATRIKSAPAKSTRINTNSYVNTTYIPNTKYSIGYGWELLIPQLNAPGSATMAAGSGAYYREWLGEFKTETGAVYSVLHAVDHDDGAASDVFAEKSLTIEDAGERYIGTLDYVKGSSVPTVTIDGISVEYMKTVREKTGKTYYFRNDRIQAIVDRYGNAIRYIYDENLKLSRIIDSMGREIEFDHSGTRISAIRVMENGTLVQKITYVNSIANNASLDPNNNLTYDNTYKLSVSRWENSSEQVLTTVYHHTRDDIMQYWKSTYANTLTTVVPNRVFTLRKIVYPNGLTTEYTYSLVEKYMPVGTVEVYKLASRKDTVGGTVKNQYTYSYSASDAAREGRGVSADYDEIWFSGTVSRSDGLSRTDRYDREYVLSGSVTTANGYYYGEEYSYKMMDNASPIPVLTMQKYSDKGDSTYVIYNDYDAAGNLLEHMEGPYNERTWAYGSARVSTELLDEWRETNPRRVTYTYGKYGNVLTEMRQTDEDTYYKLENTLDSAEKHVVTAREYTSSDNTSFTLIGTTAYTYDSAGNVTGTTRDNEVRTYTYTYDGIGGYTLQSTASGLADADGTALPAVTETTVYDFWGNPASVTDGRGNTTVYTYDLLSRPLSVTAPDSTVTSYTHDSVNNITTAVYPNGSREKVSYDALGNLTSVYVDGSGAASPVWQETERRTYDAFGRMTEARSITGYNASGTANMGTVMRYTYYPYDMLKTEEKRTLSGSTTDKLTYTYDMAVSSGDYLSDTGVATTSMTRNSASGSIYTHVEDESAAIRQIYRTRTFAKNLFIDPTSTASITTQAATAGKYAYLYAKLGVNNYSYKAKVYGDNVLLQEGSYPGDNKHPYHTLVQNIEGVNTLKIESGASSSVSRLVMAEPALLTLHDYKNGPGEHYTKVTITRDATTTLTPPTVIRYYNRDGELVKEKQQDGDTLYTSTRLYDRSGRLIEVRDAEAFARNIPYSQKYEYDVHGNVVKEYNALGDSRTLTYDSLDRLTAESDFIGNTVTYTYDGLGRQIKSSSPIDTNVTGVVKSYYDGAGNLIKTVNDSQVVEYTYDSMQRLLTVQESPSADKFVYTQYGYDNMGNCTVRLTGLAAPLSDVNAAYNPETDAHAKHTYTYNLLGQMTAETDPYGASTAYTYALGGNVLTKTDRAGIVTTYTYDTFGRLTNETAAKDGNSESISYTYDRYDNLKTQGNITYTYDNLFRLTKEERSGHVNHYTYDANGNRLTHVMDVGESPTLTETYTYDNAGRMASYAGSAVNQTVSASYTYNKNGALESSTSGAYTTLYTYTPAGQAKTIQYKNGETVEDTITYTYNAQGLISIMNRNAERCSYSYDGRGFLNTAGGTMTGGGTVSHSWTYDLFGNISYSLSLNSTSWEYKEIRHTHDKNNRLLNEELTIGIRDEADALHWTETITDFTYDANGNELSRISEITPDGGTVTTKTVMNTYNLFGKLSNMSVTENGTTTSMQYLYDSDGLLKRTDDGSYKLFYWDNGQLSTQMFGSGEAYRVYFRGMELHAAKTDTQLYRYRQNAHGDVIQMTNGTETKNYIYDPFGQQIGANGIPITDAADTNPIRYAGEYLDAHSGNYYLRNRYYNPGTGRFTQEDPIKDGLNWYVYCRNNPVNYIDPNGLSGIKTDGTYYITHPLDKELLKLKQEYVSATPERQAQIAAEAQNIRNSGEKGVDWSVQADRTLDYYMIDTDVTKKLNDVIKSSESENWWKRFGEITPITNAARYADFALMVRPGGEYDLKSKSEWQGKEHFIYNGEIIWYDEPGNILYGHLGKVMGFEDIILKSAGGAVQIATGTSSWSYVSSYFDDPRDQKAIQKGIDIFKNTHSWIWW